jgi:hypothetical protein
MQSRNLEISDIDLGIKHTSVQVEHNHGRFCFVSDNEEAESGIKRFDFHLYVIDNEKFQLKDIGKQKSKLTTECIFSSNGTNLALVNKQHGHPFRGIIEFYAIKQDKNTYIKLIKEQKMIYMSYAEWDPSGKLLITASNNTKTFMIWNSFGNMIFKDTVWD